MDINMKIEADLVKKLREEKSWSQEHLAEVCGLSLRTIQRVEGEGTGSPETKMALSAAFGVSGAELTPKLEKAVALSLSRSPGLIWGYTGVAIGGIAACVSAIFSQNSAFETGASLGAIGLLTGFCCAGIGLLSNRNKPNLAIRH